MFPKTPSITLQRYFISSVHLEPFKSLPLYVNKNWSEIRAVCWRSLIHYSILQNGRRHTVHRSRGELEGETRMCSFLQSSFHRHIICLHSFACMSHWGTVIPHRTYPYSVGKPERLRRLEEGERSSGMEGCVFGGWFASQSAAFITLSIFDCWWETLILLTYFCGHWSHWQKWQLSLDECVKNCTSSVYSI